MATKNNKHVEPEEIKDFEDELKGLELDTSSWEEDHIGFPAYWEPEVGRKFCATLILIDATDPDFIRHVFEAQHDTRCARGAVNSQEEVIVPKGELFSVGLYAGIPFSRYEGETILCTVKDKRSLPPSTNPAASKGQRMTRDMFVWSVKVPPGTKTKLLEKRRQEAKVFLERARAMQLQGKDSNPGIVTQGSAQTEPAL